MPQDSFVVAQHSSEGRLILTVCDSSVHGKRLEDKDAVVDSSSKFYRGNEKDEADVRELMLKAYTIHAVGKNAVAIAVALGLAVKSDVKTVADVPHLQILIT
ncbi:DUF424 domain-containing protein [Candidatus Woesearchaeota archaeon]|nr:DUF424 domain-containing protein [Candidatus Woesearchaeota archaeon]